MGSLDEGGFFIEEDGTGISPDIRNEVFESGFSSVEGSPGYGLSIVKGIVETHDWAISIDEADSGGARFEITGVNP